MFRYLSRLLLVAALALAACGGDDGGDDGSGEGALTKEEVIEEGDRICAEAEEELDAVEGIDTNPFEEGADTDAFLDGLDEGIEITENRLERFRELEGPEEDQATLDRLVELQEESLERIKEFRTAVEEGNAELGNQLITENSTTAEEAEQLASEYGFEECGSVA